MDGQEVVKTIGWLGESWGFWIQTGAFFLSALGAIGVIYYNGKQARTRALIDLIIHQKTDKTLIYATALVYKLQKEGNHLSQHIANIDGEECKAILKVLNNQEFIAVGIRMGAFNEDVYKEMQCSNVLKLWNAAKGFVAEFREQTKKQTIFQDLETLADKWEKNPIKKLK